MRRLAALALLASLAACGDDSAGPAPEPQPPTPVGRWAARSLDGRPLPALVNEGIEPAGWRWTVHVLADSITITDDGRWVHRTHFEERNTLGEVYPQLHADSGVWTRSGDSLSFVSTFIENSSFAGRLTADGRLEVLDNVIRDDGLPLMRLVHER